MAAEYVCPGPALIAARAVEEFYQRWLAGSHERLQPVTAPYARYTTILGGAVRIIASRCLHLNQTVSWNRIPILMYSHEVFYSANKLS